MRTLRVLCLVMGVSCALIGVYHLALGQASVPGAGPVTATLDSRERFYSAIFVGYGIAWMLVSRRSVLPLPFVRLLALVFLLAGLGRVLSLVTTGRPHWLQLAEGVVELVLPFVFLVLAHRAEVEAGRARPA